MLTPSVALALLIGAGSLTLPPWGNAADQRVAQATSLKDAGLDATKVEELDAEARRLPEYAPQQLTIWLAFHQQAADQLGGNLLGGAAEERVEDDKRIRTPLHQYKLATIWEK
jgi:hypothetical protein